jgi:hypothetical protein
VTDNRNISVRDRLAVISNLEMAAAFLNKTSAWLAEQGAEVEADQVDHAALGLLACCWWLYRPLRPPPPPERWPDQQQPAQQPR